MSGNVIVSEQDMLKSKQFRVLSKTATTVYLDFCMKCRVKRTSLKNGRKKERVILNNGELVYPYSEALKKDPPITRTAFAKAIDDLVKMGFIDITHQGSGGNKGDCSLYGISERWRNWGTSEFEEKSREKDYRKGRGLSEYWRKRKERERRERENAEFGNVGVTPASNAGVTPHRQTCSLE